MKKTNQLMTRCNINISDNESPVFILNNMCSDIISSSVFLQVMNTITLPSAQPSLFNEEELSNIQGKDVFFIQNIGQSNAFTKSTERLMAQVQTCCRTSKIINLSNFMHVNSITSNVNTVNLLDVRKLFNTDDTSFRDLLIYYANFDEEDFEFNLEAYCQAEFDADEINSLLNGYGEVIHEK